MKDTAAGGIRATQGTFSSLRRGNFQNLGFSTGNID